MPEPMRKSPVECTASSAESGDPAKNGTSVHDWAPYVSRLSSTETESQPSHAAQALFSNLAGEERRISQPLSVSRILRQHFFRRFFDNDTVSIDGEIQTAVVRALAFFAIPGLMFTFWLLPHYPGRNPWTVAADRYFLVLYSFVVMGAVAAFEWEMLFPDRSDFLILLPMPLRARELFYAKAGALVTFLSMFLVAANVFAAILFPAASTAGGCNPLRAVFAHLAAVLTAGIFSACALLALEGLLLTLLPPSWFRPVSTIIQALSIAGLLLLFLLYPLIANHLQALLSGQASFAAWIPPLWFVGLYETLLMGSSAPAASASLAAMGVVATAVAALLCLITYPAGWARQKKRALEGASQTRKPSRSVLAALLQWTLLRRPQQRAIFHFVTQTIARNPRYQVYLALYGGAGLALALGSVLTLRVGPNHVLALALSTPGLHAVLPLLLFWMVAGLRASFGFPVDMRARWIFPIALALDPSATPESIPYAYPGPAAKAARTWVALGCASLTCLVVALLLALHWSYLDLFIQAIAGATLTLLLAGVFFVGRTQIPFTRPRLPGRAGLPMVFLVYAALFPAIVLITTQLEFAAERHPVQLVWILLGAGIALLAIHLLDQLAQRGIIGGFPEDEADEGPQTLGLFQ